DSAGSATRSRDRGLDDADLRLRRHDAAQAESGLPEELGVLVLRPLLAAGHGEHDDVEDFAEVGSVARRQDELHDQERAAFLHRVATVAENREALLLGPVVDDMREDVGVAAGRNALEEVPRLDRDAIRDAAGREHPAGLGDDVGPIEEEAARTLVTGED